MYCSIEPSTKDVWKCSLHHRCRRRGHQFFSSFPLGVGCGPGRHTGSSREPGSWSAASSSQGHGQHEAVWCLASLSLSIRPRHDLKKHCGGGGRGGAPCRTMPTLARCSRIEAALVGPGVEGERAQLEACRLTRELGWAGPIRTICTGPMLAFGVRTTRPSRGSPGRGNRIVPV